MQKTTLHWLTRVTNSICLVIMIFIPLGLALMWVNLDMFSPSIMAQLGLEAPSDGFPPMTRALAWLCTMLPGGLMMWGLSQLRLMLSEVSAGHYFSLPAVSHFRRFSWAMLLYACALPVQSTLLSLVLTMHNPPGQKMLVIRLGTTELNALLIAVLFVIIAHIFEEGRKLADENAGFL